MRRALIEVAHAGRGKPAFDFPLLCALGISWIILMPADRYRLDRGLAWITPIQLESADLTGRRTLGLRQSRPA